MRPGAREPITGNGPNRRRRIQMSRRGAAFVVAFAFMAFLAATRPGAEPQDERVPQLPTFRNTLNFVRVDVVVTGSDHRPIQDLMEADFELFEDGRLQAVQDFRAVRIGDTSAVADPEPPEILTRGDEAREAARDDVRLFAIFVEPSVQCPNAERVRDALIRFVRALPPADMVAVTDGVSIMSGLQLTRDRPTLVGAIRLLGLSAEARQMLPGASRGIVRTPPRGSDCLRGRARSLAGVRELSERLAALREGRKSIIYVGASMGGGGAELTLPFYELVTALNRNNTTVYVLDPTGLTVESNFNRTVNLRALAEQTGGLAIVNTNEMERGLQTVVQDATFYYLLGYSSPALPDGKFHSIDVRVKRRGATVRSRSGFWSFAAPGTVPRRQP